MVLEVQELGRDGLNAVVYDTRPDDTATFTTAVDDHEASEDDPQWRKDAPDAVNSAFFMQYVDHEWRDAVFEYADDGLVKDGPTMEKQHEAFLVSDPSTLALRIERLSDCFIVTVEADGVTKSELTLSDAELGIERHPEF